MAYTTSANVAAYLQTTIDGTTTPTDTTVDSWITWAAEDIDSKSGRTYEDVLETELVFNTDAGRDFYLPKDYVPLISVTNLWINTGNDWDITWTALTEGTDFIIVDLKTGHIKLSPQRTLYELAQGIKITFNHGYESVPLNVTELATRLVAKKYMQSAISKVSIDSNEEIQVGPIRLGNGSAQSVGFIASLNGDIEDLYQTLNNAKTYIY